MNKSELQKFENPEALANAAAQGFLQLIGAHHARALDASGAGRLPFSVALSGGRIAGDLFLAITKLAAANPESLPQVEFFWADERCVGPDDPDSNFRLARERMLDPLEIPANRIHRIRGELQPHEAARLAEAELRQYLRAPAPSQPVLDLVFLGMGEDGHVASLFPREVEQLQNDPSAYRAVVGPKPPPNRITLGFSTLAAARQVWVLVSGAGKEVALAGSLSDFGTTPLAKVLQARHKTRILSCV